MVNMQRSTRIKLTGLALGLIAIGFYVGFMILMATR